MEMMSDEFSDPLSTGGIGARCIDEVNSQVKYSKVDAPWTGGYYSLPLADSGQFVQITVVLKG